MARGSSINDLAYYGALGGGGYLAYKLALDGELGCSAYKAMAEIYRSLKGKAPAAPRADSQAGRDAKCKDGIPGSPAAPSAAAPVTPASTAAPAAPAPTSPSAPSPTPSGPPDGPPYDASLVHATTLTDQGMMPVLWDENARQFRQDPSQGGVYFYGTGNYFIDSNQRRWTWLGPEEVLVAWDNADTALISDFFA